MDKFYKNLLDAGWKMTDIDNSDIYDLIRLFNKEKETGVADKSDVSAFNFLP